MKIFNFPLLLLFALFASAGLSAQTGISGEVPMDPGIRTGKLENGLTYFIRYNKEPEKRASFYIIQNVGAILEDDDQDGLAHFLEHMAFNGTKNFPGKKIISGLEKHGVGFGSNINAYTSFDETVYNLSDVPVERADLIDTCLLILHDWSDFITLDENEIDNERGVILEEWRTGADASRRMIFKQVFPVLMKDSKYAVRDIIGDPEIIKSFSYNTLRNFYHDWYRTDLQAIAVIGDIDVGVVESKIKTLFSKISAVPDPPARHYEVVPFHKEPYFALATDKEAAQTSVSVITLHENTPPEKRDMKYLRDSHIISLMNSMMSVRINELLQKGDPPFIAGSVWYGEYYPRMHNALSVEAVARENEEALALEAVYTEAEKARRYGFGKYELERAKARTLSNLENTWKQKDKISNDTYAQWITNYFLTGEPATSADFDLEFFKEVMHGITAEEISEKFRELMTNENSTIIIQGPDDEDIKHLTENEALDILAKVRNSTPVPYEDKAPEASLINKELKGSPVIKTIVLPLFNAEEWTLANNIKVVYRKADYEKDNIMLSAFSFGGTSKVEDDNVLAAQLMPTLMTMYGAGDHDNISLQKMLSGKKAAVELSLNEVTETIAGTTTPNDFETMMQLLYLKLAEPRFDPEAHSAITGRLAAMIASQEKNPDKVKSDSISLITSGYHPRTVILTAEKIGNVTIDQIRKVYTERFAGADEFTFFIVGNTEKEVVKPLVEKYIGSLPVTGRTETWIDRKVGQPEGRITRELSMQLTVPKSTVFISFSNKFRYEPYNYLGLQVIQGILDLVYTEKVREEEGGTYGVSLSLTAQKRPEPKGKGMIMFDCDPARAKDLKSIIYNEINALMKQGPSKENLDKSVLNILKNREESKMHNAYWMNTLTRYYSYGINADDPKNYEDILKSFSEKDIRKIARKMFKKADVADILFMPTE